MHNEGLLPPCIPHHYMMIRQAACALTVECAELNDINKQKRIERGEEVD